MSPWLCSIVLLVCCPVDDWHFRIERSAVASVAAGEKPSEYFVIFTADYCAPCKQMKRDELPKLKAAGYQVTEVDIQKETQWAEKVVSLPTIWLVDRETRQPMQTWVGFTSMADLLAPESIDGVCRLSANGKRWSGVAVSDGFVLTCAHHDEPDNITLEFPVGSHGSKRYISLRGKVRKFNREADVSIVEFRLPKKYRLKTYQVKDGTPATIKGYGKGVDPKSISTSIRARDRTAYGFPIVTLSAVPESGMSGAPVFAESESGPVVAGMQFGGHGSEVDMATVDTITKVLQEASQ